jgi:protocadherin-16/23
MRKMCNKNVKLFQIFVFFFKHPFYLIVLYIIYNIFLLLFTTNFFCLCLIHSHDTGGNVGNKFNIDLNTGELTARPLDREQTARYLLQITAQDRGIPTSYQSTCNITIIVEDQNDNDPRFELPKYVATIPEDIAIGTSVISVKAIDADLGINSRIVYSLANETEWLFNIDNHSGLITTAG